MIMRTRIGISNFFSRGGVTMPNIKSAKKRVKVIAVKTEKNKALRFGSAYRNQKGEHRY